MARLILVGQAGSPGAGVGRLLWLDGESNGTGHGARARIAGGDGRRRGGCSLPRSAGSWARWRSPARSSMRSRARHRERAGAEVGAIFEAQGMFARDPGLIEPALPLIRDGRDGRGGDRPRRRRAGGSPRRRRRRVSSANGRPIFATSAGASSIGSSAGPDPISTIGTGRARSSRPRISIPRSSRGSGRSSSAGLALAAGAPNGHAAIVARALGIPLVLGLGAALHGGLAGRSVAIDGGDGRAARRAECR